MDIRMSYRHVGRNCDPKSDKNIYIRLSSSICHCRRREAGESQLVRRCNEIFSKLTLQNVESHIELFSASSASTLNM